MALYNSTKFQLPGTSGGGGNRPQSFLHFRILLRIRKVTFPKIWRASRDRPPLRPCQKSATFVEAFSRKFSFPFQPFSQHEKYSWKPYSILRTKEYLINLDLENFAK